MGVLLLHYDLHPLISLLVTGDTLVRSIPLVPDDDIWLRSP